MSEGPPLDNNGLVEATSYRPINPWVVSFSVMLATFMEVLDTSIANVALPHIAGNLSATVDEGTWVLTSYLVANGIVLPLSGWLTQLFGRKRLYLTCVSSFTLSSFLCGVAPNLSCLIFFRVLQGISGGAMQPLAQSILVESFPREKRGMAMAFYGMGVVVAPIIGPTLGGWITDSYSWRWIFFINIPMGVIAVFLNSIVLHDPPHLVRRSLDGVHWDFIGLVFLSLGLGSLQIVLDTGQKKDWFSSSYINTLSAICIASIVFAVIWELNRKDPVVNFHLLRNRDFAMSTVVLFVVGFVLYGSTVLLPLFLQTLMGYNSFNSGLVMSPGGIVTLFMMPVAGFLTGKIPAKWLIATGLTIGAAGLLWMSKFNLNISFSHAVASRMIISAALAFLFVPINSVAYSHLPKQVYGQAAGLINLSRNLGGSFGIALVTTFIARRAAFHQSVLANHTTEYNPIFLQMADKLRAGLIARGVDAYTSVIQSKVIIYRILQQQAAALSYMDAFWLLCIMFLAVIPVALFLRDKVTKDNKLNKVTE
jgi:MFS transporter, DHA2 family, multidrug resistance protein